MTERAADTVAFVAGWQGCAFEQLLEHVLRTPRLLLEPLQPTHADEMWLPLNDARLYTHIPQNPTASMTVLRERYTRLSTRRSPTGDELWLNWVLREPPAGHCRGRLEATVRADASAYIAYEIFPEHWQRGLATESCRAMIGWLIDALHVQRFTAEVDSLNEPSLRLLDRLGFARTGFREAADEFKGRVSDEWTFWLEAAQFVRATGAADTPVADRP